MEFSQNFVKIWSVGVLRPGMVHGWSRQRAQVVIKMIVAASLTGLCMFILGQSSAGGSLDMAPLTSPSSRLDFSNWDTGSLDTNAFFGRHTNWVSVPAAHNFISRKVVQAHVVVL